MLSADRKTPTAPTAAMCVRHACVNATYSRIYVGLNITQCAYHTSDKLHRSDWVDILLLECCCQHNCTRCEQPTRCACACVFIAVRVSAVFRSSCFLKWVEHYVHTHTKKAYLRSIAGDLRRHRAPTLNALLRRHGVPQCACAGIIMRQFACKRIYRRARVRVRTNTKRI